MNIVNILWGLLNGKKINTGAIVLAIAFMLEHYLTIDNGMAQQIASQLMYGFGGVSLLIGIVHREMKKRKKEE